MDPLTSRDSHSGISKPRRMKFLAMGARGRVLHQHDIVAMAEKGGKDFQVLLQNPDFLSRRELPAVQTARHSGFGVRRKPADIRRAAFRLAEELDLADEGIREPALRRPIGIEWRVAPATRRGERKMKLCLIGFPIGGTGFLPATEPLQAVADVADFVLIDSGKNFRGLVISGPAHELGSSGVRSRGWPVRK